jgi:hypothetical protein
MPYRYTDTNKWSDSWYLSLRPIEKLLFQYLCDNCDIAGFIEVNPKLWAIALGSTSKEIEGALKGLERGLISSELNDCVYLRTFLKHQKNLPLKPEKNPAHKGIFKRFENYQHKFKIENVYEFVDQCLKGLPRGYGNGNGNGNGSLVVIDNIESSITIKTWKNDFKTYQEELLKACKDIITPAYIKERENFHPGLDIYLTLIKAYTDYWNKEEGWKNKKSTKTKDINWEATFNNSLSSKLNQVWKTKTNIDQTPKYEKPKNILR